MLIRYPALKEMLELINTTKTSRFDRFMTHLKLNYKTAKFENLKLFRFFFYNLVNIPIMMFVIVSLQRAAANPGIRDTPFLWMKNVYVSDPTYILPFVSCSIFWLTFGLGIDPLTKDQLIGRLRMLAQRMMIFWFIFMAHWPAVSQFYIFCNASLSYLMVRAMQRQKVISLIQGKDIGQIVVFATRTFQAVKIDTDLQEVYKTKPKIRVSEAEAVYRMQIKMKDMGVKSVQII